MQKDIFDILRALPHRFPALLVDRILSLTDEEVVGLKNVTINEPFFQGHFPDDPVMPGVLIVEAMAQAGGLLAFHRVPDMRGNSVYFMGMDKVRFRKPVRPGDQLIFRITLTRQKGPVFKMRGEAFVSEQLVAEAEIMATVAPRGAAESAATPENPA